MDITPNVLFYTFSTIAQTLAGAIALLSAFVLYRMQSLGQNIQEESSITSGWYDEPTENVAYDESHRSEYFEKVKALHYEQQYRKVAEFVTNTPWPEPRSIKIKRALKLLCRHLDQKDCLLSALNVSLGLTVVVIVLSVFALTAPIIIPIVVTSKCVSIVLFITGVAALIVCMVSYVILIHKALDGA